MCSANKNESDIPVAQRTRSLDERAEGAAALRHHVSRVCGCPEPSTEQAALVETSMVLLPLHPVSSSQAPTFPSFSLLPPPSQCLLEDPCIHIT